MTKQNPKAQRRSKLTRARRAVQLEQEMRIALAHERDELVNILMTIQCVLFNSRTYRHLSGLWGEQDHVGKSVMTEPSNPDDIPLTPAQRQELSVRLDAYRRDPDARISWEDALTIIQNRHRSEVLSSGEG